MCIDSLGCDRASIRTASPGDVIKPTLALESGVLRCAEAFQRGELIDSEGVLAVEFCKPVMFADRIRQGHKLFFAHVPYTVEHVSFNYVQLANEGTTDRFSTHLVKEKKKEEAGRGRPVYPYPPFSRLRVTTGLVSKKVVKIELVSDPSGRRPGIKGGESQTPNKPQTKSEVLNRINGSAELYDDQLFSNLRESRTC